MRIWAKMRYFETIVFTSQVVKSQYLSIAHVLLK